MARGMGGGAPLDVGEDGEPRAKGEPELPYKKEGIIGVMKARGGWLTIFFVGLVLAALVVEQFEHLLQANVELSYFVPLLIGHGGNTGSQSVATVIRAVALRHVGVRDMLHVIFKESAAGFLMGLALGLVIYVIAIYWSGLEVKIGLVVCISMPLVSAWANMLGGLLPLLSVYLGYNPAVTSAPLMTHGGRQQRTRHLLHGCRFHLAVPGHPGGGDAAGEAHRGPTSDRT